MKSILLVTLLVTALLECLHCQEASNSTTDNSTVPHRLTSPFRTRRKKIQCFVCDSRENFECTYNLTSALATNKVLTVPVHVCTGSCVKTVSRSPEGSYVRRSCTRDLFLSHLTAISDFICVGNSTKGEDEMCICFKDLCNNSLSTAHSWILPMMATFLAIVSSTYYR